MTNKHPELDRFDPSDFVGGLTDEHPNLSQYDASPPLPDVTGRLDSLAERIQEVAAPIHRDLRTIADRVDAIAATVEDAKVVLLAMDRRMKALTHRVQNLEERL